MSLAGSEVHGKKSGVAHVVCEDEKICLDEIRMLLTYLPQNCSKEAKAELGCPASAAEGDKRLAGRNVSSHGADTHTGAV